MKTKIKAGNRAGALADYNNDVGGVKTLFDATSDTGTGQGEVCVGVRFVPPTSCPPSSPPSKRRT
jgi:hypothetical protein